MKAALTPIAARFAAKVEPEPNSGCSLWTGATILSSGGRYGVLGVGRRGTGLVLAHRLSYELAVGRIPLGVNVLHRCDNARCVNPAHLFLGTQSDNMRDCVAKGRYVSDAARRTHCPRGHAYDEVNTLRSNGRRHCRICRRAQAGPR